MSEIKSRGLIYHLNSMNVQQGLKKGLTMKNLLISNSSVIFSLQNLAALDTLPSSQNLLQL